MLVGSFQLAKVDAEYVYIKDWAKDNHLYLYASKTRDMLVLPLYALRILLYQCLPSTALNDVAKDTTLAHLMYASQAWWGYVISGDMNRIERLIRRVKRSRFLPSSVSRGQQFAVAADYRQFSAICLDKTMFCVNCSPFRHISYTLRSRTLNFSLPVKDDRNFISRVLYKKLH